MNNNRSVKPFIILASIFLGVSFMFLLFELLANYECLKIIAENHENNNNLGEAIGQAIGVGFSYIFTVAAGIFAAAFSIPVIPFSIVILVRQKKNPAAAIVFLVLAALIIIVSIAIMFILPYGNHGDSSSYISSSSASY